MATVADIMTKKVISVRQDASLREAAQMLHDWRFDGLPVVDENRKLVGILTQYDLLSSELAMHIPTLQNLLAIVAVEKADRNDFLEAIAPLENLKVADVMNTDPLTFAPDTVLDEMIRVFREHHRVNPIPVIDTEGGVVGVVSRYDIVKLFGYTEGNMASDAS